MTFLVADTILEGVLGSIGALTAIVATIIAVREHMKRKKKNIGNIKKKSMLHAIT